jgi:hypothetical protein
MRTLLVSLLALGMVAILIGCEPTAQRPPEPTKTPEVKTPPVKAPTIPVGPAVTSTVLRATPPKGPALPPVAGKVAEGKTAIRVNCGGTAYTDKNGIVWAADGRYSATRKAGYVVSTDGGDNASHPMDALDRLYAAERWGMKAYQFDVPNGKYTVRLHFAEIYDLIAKEGMRTFTVTLQGKPVLEKFDITKDAGGFAKVTVKEFKDIEVTDGKLMIGFDKVTEFPTIQAIEVLGQ